MHASKLIYHVTVVFLVAWPLMERWAGVDLVWIETSLLSYVNDALHIVVSRKAVRFLSNQDQYQPHFHSKARQPSKQVQNGLLRNSAHKVWLLLHIS